MIDILVYVFERYGAFAKRPKSQALALKLQAAGFAQDEISEAIEWLDTLSNTATVSLPADARSQRIYTELEVRQLGVEGIDFLCFLERAHFLAPALRETVVDRAMAVRDGTPSLEHLKVMVLMVLWSQSVALGSLVVEELLGHRDAAMH